VVVGISYVELARGHGHIPGLVKQGLAAFPILVPWFTHAQRCDDGSGGVP